MSISEKRIFRSYGMITMGTFLMALLPSCALSLSFVRFTEVKAVSVAEK